MKVLFDQGVPLPLRKFFITDWVKTAFEMGWSELKNGALIQQLATLKGGDFIELQLIPRTSIWTS